MSSEELHVIFGTGPLGMAVMRELVTRGKQVRVVNRSGRADVPAGVEVLPAEASDHESARQACQGSSVIYNCTKAPYTEWPEKFPPIMEGVISGASSAGAKLVVADNLYMYGPVSGRLTEDLPYKATGRKGRTRARMAERVMEAHHNGKVRATIGRASDFYGSGVLESAVGERVLPNILTGKAADVLGNPDVLHTYTYINDFARGLVTLGERDEALGEVWHIPSAETLTTRQFLTLVAEEAGMPLRMRVAARPIVTVMALFNPVMRELKEMLYEFEQPFVVDHSKFERAFGAETTPHREAIRKTLDWYREWMKQSIESEAAKAAAIS